MEDSIVVIGRISDPTHIELEKPVLGIHGRVELIVRPAVPGHRSRVDIAEIISALPAGNRTKQDIDRQIETERLSWGAG